jgi:hypothetical protein
MKTLGSLVSYTLAVGVLVGGLMIGMLWLTRPGPAVNYQAKAAPIPPRIAESLERKRLPEPVLTPVTAAATEATPVKPVMVEAHAALTSQPATIKVREFAPPPPKRKPPRQEPAVVREVTATPVRTVSTARTDSPY